MASTEVRAVRGRAEFHRFIDYAYEINARDPHWIPPLRMSERERLTPKKNPFFAHADVELLLAWRGRQIVGRIAAIDDRLHNQTHGDNVVMFGFFEAEDGEAARTLLERVEAWARTRGRAHVRGPLNPSLNESAGLLIEGFDTDPMLLMPHNPPAYADFIESAGYRKAKDLFAWLYALDREFPAVAAKLARRMRHRHPRHQPGAQEHERPSERAHALATPRPQPSHRSGAPPPARRRGGVPVARPLSVDAVRSAPADGAGVPPRRVLVGARGQPEHQPARRRSRRDTVQ